MLYVNLILRCGCEQSCESVDEWRSLGKAENASKRYMRIFFHHPARTPIIDAIQRYKSIDKAPFHIPGHKRGAFCPEQLTKIISSDVLTNDLTELPGASCQIDANNPHRGKVSTEHVLLRMLWIQSSLGLELSTKQHQAMFNKIFDLQITNQESDRIDTLA